MELPTKGLDGKILPDTNGEGSRRGESIGTRSFQNGEAGMRKFPFVLMRGGTSKGVFFHEKDMPRARERWDAFLLDVMGSPDVTQIDGLGGANSLTSKVAIISPSEAEGVDVDYLFAQVSLEREKVAWDSNCGNISAAVGPFVVEEGLVDGPLNGSVRIGIYNVNSKKRFISEFDVEGGRPLREGHQAVSGVPGTAPAVWLSFYSPAGSLFGRLLPTGNVVDLLPTSRGELPVSIVDSGAPLIFVRREDVGLSGTEMPGDFSDAILDYLEEVRRRGASFCRTGIASPDPDCSPAVPKMAVVGGPLACRTLSGEDVDPEAMDISVRMLSMQKPHNALAITGAVGIATASAVEGTLVQEITGPFRSELRIGHFGGVMTVGLEKSPEGGVAFVKVLRTARRIAEGFVYTKKDY